MKRVLILFSVVALIVLVHYVHSVFICPAYVRRTDKRVVHMYPDYIFKDHSGRDISLNIFIAIRECDINCMDSIVYAIQADTIKIYKQIVVEFYRYGPIMNERTLHTGGQTWLENLDENNDLLVIYYLYSGKFSKRSIMGDKDKLDVERLYEPLNYWRGKTPPQLWDFSSFED